MQRFRIIVAEKEGNFRLETIVTTRNGTSLKSIVLKGIEPYVNQRAADPLDFMREVKYLYRESDDLDGFIYDLENELDLLIAIGDLNNHSYIKIEDRSFRTTALEEGTDSYQRAWEEQLDNIDGEQDFNVYKPCDDDLIEHGNEIMQDYLDEYEIVK